MSKKIKKINSGIGDLRLLATFAFLMGIIFLILNLWNGIQISVDTYVEYKNNNIVEYTKNFIETERDEDIYIEDAEYIKTEKDAKQYMYSYIGDTALSVLISFISVCAYYQLARFFDKENMENPYDEIPKKRLKKALKYLYASCITWLLGGVILTTIFVNASVSYSSNAGFDFILYALLVAFIQFIIYLLEKGQLKKASKEA